MRTKVAIVGAGPAGLLLSHLLEREGVANVVVEARSREYVMSRIRAGVLEQRTTEVLRAVGLGERLAREGYVHHGISISGGGCSFHVDFRALTGKSVTIYGQTELQKDLFQVRDAAGAVVVDEAEGVSVHGVDTKAPRVTFTKGGKSHTVHADFVAGCDGHHGVCRAVIPPTVLRTYERTYSHGWLGVLSETPPVSPELIYAQHDRGFALCSMRNPGLSRYYVQCGVDETIADWPDERFWKELRARLPKEAAERLVTGPSIEKSVTPLRSFVAEPMQYGRLFLAGDAAHIVPPTGAKGLNMAVADVVLLAEAFGTYYRENSEALLEAYSSRALERVWKAIRFSWWMTTLLHRADTGDAFAARLQQAELGYLRDSKAAQTALAENYVGLVY
jgi:p-hydroxybenzoate 3-monooxygenase